MTVGPAVAGAAADRVLRSRPRTNPAVEAVAAGFLVVVALAALQNAQRGTLGVWLRAKFLNAGEPLPLGADTAGAGRQLNKPGSVLPVPSDQVTPNVVPGARFGDPLPGGRFMSGWGAPRDGGQRSHQGVDLGAGAGTPILSVASGTVRYAKEFGRCGIGVSVEHADGWRSVYCHLQAPAVTPGQTVTQGQVVGYVGQTGNAQVDHLHFELRYNDAPVDPRQLIGR